MPFSNFEFPVSTCFAFFYHTKWEKFSDFCMINNKEKMLLLRKVHMQDRSIRCLLYSTPTCVVHMYYLSDIKKYEQNNSVFIINLDDKTVCNVATGIYSMLSSDKIDCCS
jgi:hypothetical protein